MVGYIRPGSALVPQPQASFRHEPVVLVVVVARSKVLDVPAAVVERLRDKVLAIIRVAGKGSWVGSVPAGVAHRMKVGPGSRCSTAVGRCRSRRNQGSG